MESTTKPRSRAKHVHENFPDALIILLRELGIAHTAMLLQQLKGHPTFPSLHALSEVLIQAGIQNVAAQLSYEDLLDKAPLPAVVNVKGGTEYSLFFVLRAVNEQGVKLLDGEGKEMPVPKGKFLTDWTGLVLLCDPGETQREPNYWQHRIEAWFRGYGALVLGLVLLLLIGLSFSLHSTALMGYPLLHLGGKMAGLVISYLLMVRLFDRQNPWIKQLCHSAKAGSQADCSSILDSPAAYAIGKLTWSEVGFLYFLTTLLFGLAFPGPASWSLMSLLSLAALPYIFYSVGYQYWVAQRWCRLCLGVQVVLLAEGCLGAWWMMHEDWTWSIFLAGLRFACMAACFGLLYFLVKPQLQDALKHQQNYPKLNRVRLDPEVFDLMLRRSRSYSFPPAVALQIGNAEGKDQLLVVTNPTCAPCQRMHHDLLGILDHKTEASVQEVLLPELPEQSFSFQVAVAMLSLSERLAPEELRPILADFYQRHTPKSRQAWLATYQPDEATQERLTEQVHQSIQWCNQNGVRSTPEIYLNGYLLPPAYTVKDLAFLID